MNKLIYIIIVFSNYAFCQTFIGIPFLDKCQKMTKCELCNSENKNFNAYFETLNIKFDELSPSEDSQNAIKKLNLVNEEIDLIKKQLTQIDTSDVYLKSVLAKLLFTKANILIKEVYQINDTIYNLAQTDFEHLQDFNGVAYINELIDEIISLNISDNVNLFAREYRLKYLNESYAFSEISLISDDWYTNKNLKQLKGESEQKLNAAKIILEDEKLTDYVPFSSFLGIGLGAIAAIGKGNWYGYEISDEYVEYSNPFLLWHPISASPHFRFSLVSTSFLWQRQDPTKQDLLISALNFKHPILNVNLIQFGTHFGLAEKGKWFYRPEIGLSYGIFKLGYAYNLTFDKTFRPQTEKHLFTFGISYPLFRVGAYY